VAYTTVTGSNTQTGGSKDAITVSHTHTNTLASVSDHVHTLSSNQAAAPGAGTGFYSIQSPGGGVTSVNTLGAGGHTHSLTIDSTGSSGTNANLTPYYALAFIMKT
jgi:hypothetical protein